MWYRIRNTRCYANNKASYARYLTYNKKLSLTADLDKATQFYFTGAVEDGVMTAKIHNSVNANLMAGEALWNAKGYDWYIKTHVSDQGGTDAKTGKTYEGVLICDKSDFKVNWYVGSSDTSIKLYDYQWDGNIFTLEEVEAPTGTEEMENEKLKMNNEDDAVYDLCGRQIVNSKWLNGKYPKGFYVRKGHKYIIK